VSSPYESRDERTPMEGPSWTPGNVDQRPEETDRDRLVLSKYERVKIIAIRTEQLLNGAPCLLEREEEASFCRVSDIAEREFVLGLLPMSIARKLESGKVRIYDLAAFIDPMDQGQGKITRSST